MGPEFWTSWLVYPYVAFLFFGLVFAFFIFCRIVAGPPSLSIRQLINKKIIDVATLKDIYISEIGGRLTINKLSFPLQYYSEGYRQTFNAYLSTVLADIGNTEIFHGKVDHMDSKSFKVGKVRKFVVLPLFLIGGLTILLSHVPPYVDFAFFAVLMTFTLFQNSQKWKLSDHRLLCRNGFIALKNIHQFNLYIPEKKLYFELELDSGDSKYSIRDRKLKRLLPIIAILNRHLSESDRSTA
jgi:hypothetical protein